MLCFEKLTQQSKNIFNFVVTWEYIFKSLRKFVCYWSDGKKIQVCAETQKKFDHEKTIAPPPQVSNGLPLSQDKQNKQNVENFVCYFPNVWIC